MATVVRFRLGDRSNDLVAMTKPAMRWVARRHLLLSEEIAALDEQLDRVVVGPAPALVALRGVSTAMAASSLIVVRDG